MKTRRPKRYFGMSLVQLGILAGMACLACSITGTGLFFIVNSLEYKAATTSDASLETPQPTMPPTQTPTPTSTTIPTPTPTSYKDLIPEGWQQYRDASYFGFEIWFPPEYTPVDPRGKLEEIIKAYEDSGDAETAQLLAASLEEEVTHYTLWMADTLPTALRYQTNISLATYPLERKKLADYIDARIEGLPTSTRLMERRPYHNGEYQAERVWLESSLSNTSLGQVMYFIHAGGNVWVITCYTHFNEFYTRLPIFDQIASTFRTLDQ
ncbi:MAG: hypothetical protein ACOYYU_12440 [Chloroflexota bacterium]